MKVQVRYFASLREALGGADTVDLPAGSTIARGQMVRYLPFAELLG